MLLRKYVNYYLEWPVNLAEHHVAMAPYGGPVGKDSSQRYISPHVEPEAIHCYSCHAKGLAEAKSGEKDDFHLHPVGEANFVHSSKFPPNLYIVVMVM